MLEKTNRCLLSCESAFALRILEMAGVFRRYDDMLERMLQDGISKPPKLPIKYLRYITNNFSAERQLGGGGYGTVYKGVLSNGKTIAVKKLKSSGLEAEDKHFENEACHLMKLKHPNVVLLLGWCSDTENVYVEHDGKWICAENSERLLCLEYMPKGNLREYLKDAACGLGWDMRYTIIKGICYGLHYLHEEQQHNGPVIHLDLKPENILLDDNMIPKIADFGLSRLIGEEKTRAYTGNFRGTLGYMAREYINEGLISIKSDIFSLGVIIIEIVTGNRDYPNEFGIPSHEFIEHVLKNWRNRLQNSLNYTVLGIYYQQIKRCIEIGLMCVEPDRSKRPTTGKIIKMLHELSESADFSGREEDFPPMYSPELHEQYNMEDLPGDDNDGIVQPNHLHMLGQDIGPSTNTYMENAQTPKPKQSMAEPFEAFELSPISYQCQDPPMFSTAPYEQLEDLLGANTGSVLPDPYPAQGIIVCASTDTDMEMEIAQRETGPLEVNGDLAYLGQHPVEDDGTPTTTDTESMEIQHLEKAIGEANMFEASAGLTQPEPCSARIDFSMATDAEITEHPRACLKSKEQRLNLPELDTDPACLDLWKLERSHNITTFFFIFLIIHNITTWRCGFEESKIDQGCWTQQDFEATQHDTSSHYTGVKNTPGREFHKNDVTKFSALLWFYCVVDRSMSFVTMALMWNISGECEDEANRTDIYVARWLHAPGYCPTRRSSWEQHSGVVV